MGLAALISTESDLQVVGQAADGSEAVARHANSGRMCLSWTF